MCRKVSCSAWQELQQGVGKDLASNPSEPGRPWEIICSSQRVTPALLATRADSVGPFCKSTQDSEWRGKAGLK